MQAIEMNLPLPISANQIWRKNRLSDKAKKFYMQVASLVATSKAKGHIPKKPIDYPVGVEVILHLGARNKQSDLDNRVKSLFDSLTKAHVWQDDSLVKKMSVEFGNVVKVGYVYIKISAHSGA